VGGDLRVAKWSRRARHKICNFCLRIELEWIIYSILDVSVVSEDVSGVLVCCERSRNGSLGVAIDG